MYACTRCYSFIARVAQSPLSLNAFMWPVAFNADDAACNCPIQAQTTFGATCVCVWGGGVPQGMPPARLAGAKFDACMWLLLVLLIEG
jgi:hypothetical protein